MRREVVQDFLNLAGIAGVALMDGQSRPYFYGLTQKLSFQQRMAMAQGIQQVVETTPQSLRSFEFQFARYQVYLYKFEPGITLLVLSDQLASVELRQAVEQLQLELKDAAIDSAIALFRMMAGNLPLPTALASGQTNETTALNGHSTGTNGHEVKVERSLSPRLDPTAVPVGGAAIALVPGCNLSDLLNAMNQISQFTSQYLGNTVVSNYWKTTRPAETWLNQFQIDRTARITVSGPLLAGQAPLNPQQQAWLGTWTQAFVERCAVVILDFPLLLSQLTLDPQQKALLLPTVP